MSAAAFSVTAFLDRRPPPSVASPRSSASPPSSPSDARAPPHRPRRRPDARSAAVASAPPSPPLPPPSTRPAPRVFCLPPRQSRHALAREGGLWIEKARVSKGAAAWGPSHTEPALPRGEHPRVDQPAPCPHATHRPRVRQPARPPSPTSPPTTQGPLEAWCFPRPAAAGHSGTRHSVRVPFQAHRCSSPIVAWLELMLDIAQLREQCTTVLSRNTGHVGST